jgi:hypothetical protein
MLVRNVSVRGKIKPDSEARSKRPSANIACGGQSRTRTICRLRVATLCRLGIGIGFGFGWPLGGPWVAQASPKGDPRVD